MKSGKNILLLIIVLVLFSPNIVFCDNTMDRQDVRDYKEFFDELFPTKEDEKPSTCDAIGTFYAECSGVKVDGYSEVFSLEDYVAGVYGPEFGIFRENEEAIKLFGILARTFVLNNTDNCKSSIEASSNRQNFTASTINDYKQYTSLSEGLVITDENGLNGAYYALSRPYDCEYQNGMCIIKRCHTWVDDLSQCPALSVSEIPTDLITFRGGSHLNGVEPYIANYYAEKKGYTVDQLVKHFYGDNVYISSLNGASSNSSGTSPNCTNGDGEYVSVDGVKFKFPNYNIEGTGNGLGSSFDLTVGNVSQCPWYAKYRAIEIIETSTLSDELKEKAKSVLLATSGNGNDWYGGKNQTLSYFQYSDDINKAKPGSIISWERNTHNMGHVGIVEKVNDDGSLVISEGWNMGGPYGDDVPSSIKIRLSIIYITIYIVIITFIILSTIAIAIIIYIFILFNKFILCYEFAKSCQRHRSS